MNHFQILFILFYLSSCSSFKSVFTSKDFEWNDLETCSERFIKSKNKLDTFQQIYKEKNSILLNVDCIKFYSKEIPYKVDMYPSVFIVKGEPNYKLTYFITHFLKRNLKANERLFLIFQENLTKDQIINFQALKFGDFDFFTIFPGQVSLESHKGNFKIYNYLNYNSSISVIPLNKYYIDFADLGLDTQLSILKDKEYLGNIKILKAKDNFSKPTSVQSFVECLVENRDECIQNYKMKKNVLFSKTQNDLLDPLERSQESLRYLELKSILNKLKPIITEKKALEKLNKISSKLEVRKNESVNRLMKSKKLNGFDKDFNLEYSYEYLKLCAQVSCSNSMFQGLLEYSKNNILDINKEELNDLATEFFKNKKYLFASSLITKFDLKQKDNILPRNDLVNYSISSFAPIGELGIYRNGGDTGLVVQKINSYLQKELEYADTLYRNSESKKTGIPVEEIDSVHTSAGYVTTDTGPIYSIIDEYFDPEAYLQSIGVGKDDGVFVYSFITGKNYSYKYDDLLNIRLGVSDYSDSFGEINDIGIGRKDVDINEGIAFFGAQNPFTSKEIDQIFYNDTFNLSNDKSFFFQDDIVQISLKGDKNNYELEISTAFGSKVSIKQGGTYHYIPKKIYYGELLKDGTKAIYFPPIKMNDCSHLYLIKNGLLEKADYSCPGYGC